MCIRDRYDANEPGVGDMEMYEEYIFGGGGNNSSTGDVNLFEGEEEDDDNDDNDDDNIIVISSSEDEDSEDDYNVHPLLSYMMDTIPESPDWTENNFSFEIYTNNIARSIIRAATSTQTSATTATQTSISTPTATATATAALSSERCCICLKNLLYGGITLHHNDHTIHVHCLIDYLANSPIIWSEMSFHFYCPLCRSPICGSVMMNS